MSDGIRGTLYVGVTTDLAEQVNEHRLDLANEFTIKHRAHRLVHFEQCDDVHEAKKRQARIRKWNRDFRIGLVERFNPEWKDLYPIIKDGEIPPLARE
jgi:putative endonuclease